MLNSKRWQGTSPVQKGLEPKSRFIRFVVPAFLLMSFLGGCTGHFEPGTPPPPLEDAEERPGLFSGEKGEFEFQF